MLINSDVWCHNEILSHFSLKLCWFNSEVIEVLLYRVKYSMNLEGVTYISQWCDRQMMCMFEYSLDISNVIIQMEKP